MHRQSLTSYHNACLIRVSARAGRYATLPIATASTTASAAAVVAVFTRVRSVTRTVRHQQSLRRRALTLTFSTPIVVQTSTTRWRVLTRCLAYLLRLSPIHTADVTRFNCRVASLRRRRCVLGCTTHVCVCLMKILFIVG